MIQHNVPNNRFMQETIGQNGAIHNKQIAARLGKGDDLPVGMNTILQRVAPIGEARDREILKDAATYVYQERPQGEVQAHVFFPSLASPTPRPLLVFFHGGFWDSPTPTQFVPHCLHFASRGAVAVAAETRTSARHGTGPLEAIEDACDLIRWLRYNAGIFHLDPNRLTLGGAAGGAFLALLATMPKLKQMPLVAGLDCRPQALVLFSALVNTSSKGQASDRFPDAKTAKRLSPMQLMRRKLPPMLFFHGKSDRITPFDEVERFRRAMRWRRNVCELVDFERQDHSFFNFNVSQKHFELTIGAADRFLVDHGMLEPEESA
jgi:acetyl esterase/lipase